MILETPANQPVPKELLALAINLVTHSALAERFCENDGLKYLLARVKKTWDPLLMKLIRNIASHGGKCQDIFMKHISTLVTMAKKSEENPDFLVEALGTLANLNMPNFDWYLSASDSLTENSRDTILVEYGLMEILTQYMGSSNTDDDILLESVILIGTTLTDPKTASVYSSSPIIPKLIDILLSTTYLFLSFLFPFIFPGKQEDDEIVLQAIYTFYRLLHHRETKKFLLKKTRKVVLRICFSHFYHRGCTILNGFAV